MVKYLRNLTVLGFGLGAVMIGGMAYLEHHGKKYCVSTPAPPQSYTIEQRVIDQVFRDHDGYRLVSQNERGVVLEEKFYDSGLDGWTRRERVSARPLLSGENQFQYLEGMSRFVVIKDLTENANPFANILRYSQRNCNSSMTHVEVHLPKNQGLTAGIDSWIEGKIPQHQPLREIR